MLTGDCQFFSPLDPLLNHSVVQNLHIHKCYVDSRHTYRLSETFTTTSAYTGKGIYCTIVTNTQTHKRTNKEMYITHTKNKKIIRDGVATPYTLLTLLKLVALLTLLVMHVLLTLLHTCLYIHILLYG